MKVKKKLSHKTKFRIFISVILLLLIGLVFYYVKVVCPIVVTLSEERVRSLATKIISTSVSEVLVNESVTYDDLVKITYDSSNSISHIETDSVRINILVRQVTELVQYNIDSLGKEGLSIALGTFTGIPFLFGFGPNISLNLVPVGTVNTSFNSSFASQGINQTLHRLYFVVSTNVGMVLPALTKNFITSLDVMLCESVIVGKVPDVYLQGRII